MKIRIPTLLALVLFVSIAQRSAAQFYTTFDKHFLFEAGIGIGGMNCATDLGGPRGRGGYYLNEINWQNTHQSSSIYVSMLYRHAIGIRLEATIGKVEAYDSILKGIANEKAIGRYQRNLSFRSNIREVALLGEFHPIMLRNFEMELPRLSPYLLGGIGIFSFDPEAQLNGEWVRLHPLHTEGQGFPEYPDRKPYKLTQANLSLGAGIRYELRNVNLRLEIVNRRLFTDYLDDVSTNYIDPFLFREHLHPTVAPVAVALYNRSTVETGSVIKRGNVNNSDAYITFSFKAGIKFGNGSGEFRRKKSGIGCKRI